MPSRALSAASMLTTPAELSATATALLPSPTAMPILRSSSDRAGAGCVALGIGDCERLARDQPADIGQRVAALGAGGRLGADEDQVVAQRAADRVGVDDLVRAASSVAAPASAKITSQRAPRSICARDRPVGATNTLTRVPVRACHSLPTDFSDFSSVGSP